MKKIKTKLSYLSCILLVGFSVQSCDNEEEKIAKMQHPVIVVAIEKKGSAEKSNGSITLLDGKGKLHSFGSNTWIAKSVSNSRQVGDTLK